MIDPKVMTLLALAENCSYTKTAKKWHSLSQR